MHHRKTGEIQSERLQLTPLTADDAEDMVEVLADGELYEFTGGQAPTVSELTARYRYQVSGSPHSRETWHNWIIRLADSGSATGFVQATVIDDTADVGWLVGVRCQGTGIAREAAGAVCRWLEAGGVSKLTAHIHPNHEASARVASSVGLRRTNRVDDDGEEIWSSE